MQATRRSFFTGLLAALCAGLCAAAAEFKPRAVFYTATGERTITPIAVTARPDGGWAATIKKESVPLNVAKVEVMCNEFFAHKGEAGWWLLGRGLMGSFSQTNFLYRMPKQYTYMPYYAIKNARGAYMAITEGMRFEYDTLVSSDPKGHYRMFPRWDLTDLGTALGRPYEDMTVVFYDLGKDADYNDMAKLYRRYRLSRDPSIKTLKERAKERPHLLKLARSIPVRQQVAHKPFKRPDDAIDFTPETEHPVKCSCSLAQVRENMKLLHDRGVEDVAVCLAGWQTGGYDGRVPAIFPVEEVVGGEAELRKTIAFGQAYGWIVDSQNNYTDCYTVSPMWDGGRIACMGPNGMLERNGSWCGGRAYNLCLRHAWEKYLPDQLRQVRGLGFHGAAYIDVFTAVYPYRCCNPEHPATRKEQAEYQRKVVDLCHELFGGFASECCYDHLLGKVDYINYVCAPMRAMRQGYVAKGLRPPVEKFVPFFELAFHDVVLSNPDKITQEVLAQRENLILVEFGGRPIFYHFGPTNVDGIVKAWEQFKRLRHLQLEEMAEHRELAPGVVRVTYGNGDRIYVNHTQAAASPDGVTVPAQDFVFLPAR